VIVVRLTIFIIALLLAVEALEPTAPWLITLAVLSGIEILRGRSIIGSFRSRRRLRGWLSDPLD
jgi:hypothetical protein